MPDPQLLSMDLLEVGGGRLVLGAIGRMVLRVLSVRVEGDGAGVVALIHNNNIIIYLFIINSQPSAA